jgi:hypothetical protein
MGRKQILIVTNAFTDEEVLLVKDLIANDNTSERNIELNLVYVIPRLPTCYFNIPAMGILLERYYNEAKQSLYQVGKALEVGSQQQWLITGKVRTEALRLANKLQSQCILTSSQQMQQMNRSLFFKQIQHYAALKHSLV